MGDIRFRMYEVRCKGMSRVQKKCAFLTLKDRTGYFIYDHLLFQPFAELGWTVEEVPWDDENIDWSSFDAAIIRSTWDYQNKPERFLSVLEKIEDAITLYNPVDICRWNLNKKYLCDLESKGVPIVPTSWYDCLNKDNIENTFHKYNSNCLVAKPLIGANACDSFVLKSGDADSWESAITVFKDREVMLQPFIESILIEGEYSLFYFGGKLSHAIVKLPAKGDYRVQEEHGGFIRPVSPADDVIRAGNRAINALDKELLYARVDLVRLASGQPVLIEMELIEPSLYFEQCPGSAEKFAEEFDRSFNKMIR